MSEQNQTRKEYSYMSLLWACLWEEGASDNWFISGEFQAALQTEDGSGGNVVAFNPVLTAVLVCIRTHCFCFRREKKGVFTVAEGGKQCETRTRV